MKLYKGRNKKGLKEGYSYAFLCAACLFWQLRHGASLAVCLSGPLWSLFHTGGSLVFGSLQLAVNHRLGLSLTAVCLI